MSLEQHERETVRVLGLPMPVTRGGMARYPHAIEPTADGVDVVTTRTVTVLRLGCLTLMGSTLAVGLVLVLVVPRYVVFESLIFATLCYGIAAVMGGLAVGKVIEVVLAALPRRSTCVRLDAEGLSYGTTTSPPAFQHTFAWAAVDALKVEPDGLTIQSGSQIVRLPLILFPEDRRQIVDAIEVTKPSLL